MQRSRLMAPALVVGLLLALGRAHVVGDDAEPDPTRTYLPMVARTYHTWYELDFGEPNDVPADAYGPLDLNQTVQAYLWDETDLGDYYRFTPTTDTEIGIELTHIPAGCDYDLYSTIGTSGAWCWSVGRTGTGPAMSA
jgi:hypothetical protein